MNLFRLICILLLGSVVLGCAGTRALHDYARSGDSVALAAGHKKTFNLDSVSVEIFPSDYDAISNPNSIVYGPGHSKIRAVTNLYIDPLSSIVVSKQSKQDLTDFARQHNNNVQFYFTDDDRDWWQTLVIIDLPTGLPEGLTTVEMSTATEIATSDLEIIAGTGSPNPLSGELVGPLQPGQLEALTRVDHHTVNFDSATVPHGIEIDFSHDEALNAAGKVTAYVVNPIGFIKNAAWKDDGYNAKVILLPTRDGEIKTMVDFKFYFTGGVTNLAVTDLKAYDIDGNPVGGVCADIDGQGQFCIP